MANGSVLTPTPLRSNSMGKTVNNTSKSNPNNNNNIRSNNHDETDTPSGVNGLSDKGNILSKQDWFRPVPKMWEGRIVYTLTTMPIQNLAASAPLSLSL